jgi:asparagine synthase (glutamine-hydrolysing)
MAFSIESRMPLLDYRLVELLFTLPVTMFVRDGWTKWVFRRAMDGQLPAEVQWRKDKMGFVTPEAVWLAQGKEQVTRMLGDSMHSDEFLDPAQVRARLGADLGDRAFYTDLFRWYIVEAWMRQAFAAAPPAAIGDVA